jgi:hypothetical protein
MKKCIIITTINPPSNQIIKYVENKPDWDIIIVADTKTPSESYNNLKCIYLSIEKQKELFPKLSELIPTRSYARKNIGYAYAFINNYDLIYDTDDDNYSDITDNHNKYSDKMIVSNNNFANIYKLYTNEKVWPRGLPIRYTNTDFSITDQQSNCPVIQGLVNGDPDVDAIFRMTNNLKENKFVNFDDNNNNTYSLSPYTFCPFNTQNTYWTKRELFHLMYLPTTVNMRFTDILRGYIAEHQLWRRNLNVKFTKANAVQTRNEHNLVKDLSDELEMFEHTEEIIEWLINNKNTNLIQIYEWLVSKNIVKQHELEILKEWYSIFTPKHKNFLYMYQTSSNINLYDNYIKSDNTRDIVAITFKTPHPDAIYLPNSTWTTGRNKMIEYALIGDTIYDYVCFMDDDISFRAGGFTNCEIDLLKHNFLIYAPYLEGYGDYHQFPSHTRSSTLWYDAICNYIKYDLLKDNRLFPYVSKYDNISWWFSQLILIFNTALYYPAEIILTKETVITNNGHNQYPRSADWGFVYRDYYNGDPNIKINNDGIQEKILNKSNYVNSLN